MAGHIEVLAPASGRSLERDNNIRHVPGLGGAIPFDGLRGNFAMRSAVMDCAAVFVPTTAAEM
jgi:hypothetical protein